MSELEGAGSDNGKRCSKPMSSPLSIIFCPINLISAPDVDCISIGLGSYIIEDSSRFCFSCSCFTNGMSAILHGSSLHLRGLFHCWHLDVQDSGDRSDLSKVLQSIAKCSNVFAAPVKTITTCLCYIAR